MATGLNPVSPDDLRCVCVRIRPDIPDGELDRYADIGHGFWALRACLCKGEGIDVRLFMLHELAKDGTELIRALEGRVAELERHVLALTRRPPAGGSTEYVQGIDGP